MPSRWDRQPHTVKHDSKADPLRAETLHIAQLTRERDNFKLRLDKALLVIDVQKTCSLAGQLDGRQRRLAVIAAMHELSPVLGAGASCRSLGLHRPERARARCTAMVRPMPRRPASPLIACLGCAGEHAAAGHAEQRTLRWHRAPAAVHATLLDDGRYQGSVRTMYRLLNSQGCSRERRHQLTHPAYVKPELLANAPNQVWSWDITKLKGPAKWTCFHLYVILDIFSRHVVDWLPHGFRSTF